MRNRAWRTCLTVARQVQIVADGWWNLPSGKLEAGEDAVAVICREADEEIGLHLDRGALSLASTVHFRNEHGEGRLGLFFHAQSWDGEPVNAEPHKCARIGWFPPPDDLPDNTYPYTQVGVELAGSIGQCTTYESGHRSDLIQRDELAGD